MKQRNVAAQIAPRVEEIERVATAFASGRCADAWLPPLLAARGLEATRGMLASLSGVPGPECEYVGGIWLTAEGRFHQFEVVVPTDGGAVEVESFDDVTDSIDIDGHRRGIGATFGFLAMEVMRRRLHPAGPDAEHALPSPR